MEHFWILNLNGLTVHMNTLIMVWAAMGLILLVAWLLTRQLSVRPGRVQLVAESIYGFCRSITFYTAGKRGDEFLYYVGALFLFILTANLMGQLPLRLISLPHGELIAATGDFNVPAALAVFTLVYYFYLGIKKKGGSYFAHYLAPLPLLMKGQPPVAKLLYAGAFWPFIFLNLLEDVTRPGSLMIRLFFNILVGEILAGIAMAIYPYVLPGFVIVLELFVAFVQAYIFAVLSSVYIAFMSEQHDEHHEGDGHAAVLTATPPAITPA